MTEQSPTQVIDFFSVAKDAGIPNNIQVIAGESVAKSRAAYLKFNVTATDNLKTYHDAMTVVFANAKTLGERVLQNTEANAKATFDAAEAISRARTWPEIAQLQSNYLQKQAVQMGAQTKEFCELSMKVAQLLFDAMGSTTAKTFEQIRKSG